MLNRLLSCLAVTALVLGLAACNESEKSKKDVKIGVSFGVGEARRWPQELVYMEARAKELGVVLEARLNKTDKPRTQLEDCLDLISSGIDVLILTPRDVRKTSEISTYARQHNVKVLSYARAVMDGNVDLFVGFDCYKIGQSLGQHLTEKVYRGNYILLSGDKGDFNTSLLYLGAMKYIKPLIDSGDIKVLLDDYVDGWSAANAKRMVLQVLEEHGDSVDAILAPNDAIAGACVEALKEKGITKKVIITGLDSEKSAVQRLVDGTQDVTVFMDLKNMAELTVDQAYNMATKKAVATNASVGNDQNAKTDAYLINGKVVTRENLDKVLIETGVYTREEIYDRK